MSGPAIICTVLIVNHDTNSLRKTGILARTCSRKPNYVKSRDRYRNFRSNSAFHLSKQRANSVHSRRPLMTACFLVWRSYASLDAQPLTCPCTIFHCESK